MRCNSKPVHYLTYIKSAAIFKYSESASIRMPENFARFSETHIHTANISRSEPAYLCLNVVKTFRLGAITKNK